MTRATRPPSTSDLSPVVRPSRRRRLPLVAVATVAAAAVAAVALWPRTTGPGPERQQAPVRRQGLAPEAQRLVGRWVRPDGGYVLEIRSVAADGRLDAGYFNPRPVNVSQARVRSADGPIEVFVELRDVNYPGATYRLIFEPRDDALYGIYTQPAVGQAFEVRFDREGT